MFPSEVEVLIVGAGPTGLALAVALQQAGVSYLVVDRLEAGRNTSRAAVIHAHTLEMLETLGVTDELARRGRPLADFTIRDRDGPLLTLNFEGLPSAHNYILMLPQDETEAVFAERLEALGGTLHRGVEARSIEQDAEGATVHLVAGGTEHTVCARFIVGADGMRSTVRERAGIAFDGDAYPESFVLADVEMQWAVGDREVSLFFSPEGLLVVAPLPDGSYRIVATFENAPEQPTLDDLQRLIDRRGPSRSASRIERIVWTSRFRLHHRVAASYRNGNLFIMGDAAHVHSPAGGQGMNTGLVDAVVLGKLLAGVLREGKPETSLDAFTALRRPAAVEVLELAGRLTGMAMTRSPFRRAVRNVILRTLDALPFVKRRIGLNLSGLSRTRYADLDAATPGGPATPASASAIVPAGYIRLSA